MIGQDFVAIYSLKFRMISNFQRPWVINFSDD